MGRWARRTRRGSSEGPERSELKKGTEPRGALTIFRQLGEERRRGGDEEGRREQEEEEERLGVFQSWQRQKLQ